MSDEYAVIYKGDRQRPAVFQGGKKATLQWLAGHTEAEIADFEIYVQGTTIYLDPMDFLCDTGGKNTGDNVKRGDAVNHPSHYNQYEGIEIIDLIEQMPFNRGSIVKYVTRAGFKSPDTEEQDLMKAKFYIERELQRVRMRNARQMRG